MSSHNLWYAQSAKNFNEALPVGNGRIGAMVYGGGVCEKITLNEDTLWSGYPRASQRECSDAWEKARQLVSEGKRREAMILLDQEHVDYLIQCYLPLATLHMQLLGDEPETSLRRELHLATACHETEFTCGTKVYRRETFISHPHQVMAVRLQEAGGAKISCEISLEGALQHIKSQSGNTLYIQGNCPDRRFPEGKAVFCYSDDPAEKGVGYRAGLRVCAKGGNVQENGGKLTILDAEEICLYFTVRTSFTAPFTHPVLQGREFEAACQADLDAAAALGYDTLRKAHLQAHKVLYDRCSLDLGENESGALPTDERLQRHAAGQEDPSLYALIVHYARYLMICSSRPGTQPANLQGIWNEKMLPPWDSNYTTNINTEMNYWPALSANLGECIQPLLDLLRQLRISGTATAKKYYDAPGFCSHHNSDLWRTSHPCPGKCQYGQWPMSTGWLCRMAYDVYRYNQDDAYLRELLPILEEASAFYISLLKEQDGYLLVFPSTSPENNYIHDGKLCSLDDTTTMSVAIVRDVLRCTSEALEHFGKDAAYYRDIMNQLLPHRITADGRLAEWYRDYEDADVHHRHVSHLYGLYPSEQINQNTPALLEACKQTLEVRGDYSTGWSLAWKINLWARLRDGDRALRLLKLALNPVPSSVDSVSESGGSFPNLFCAHPPFQIDGNFGACAGILEMLVQIDENGQPILLPALPTAWPEGSLTGLCLPGNRVLSMRWQNGQVTQYSIDTL